MYINKKGFALLDIIISVFLLSFCILFINSNLYYEKKVEKTTDTTEQAIFTAYKKQSEIELLEYDNIKNEAKTAMGNGFSTEVLITIGTQDEKNILINVYDSTTDRLLISIPNIIFSDNKVICNLTSGQMYVDGIWTKLKVSNTYSGNPCLAVDRSSSTGGRGSYWYGYGTPPVGGHWIKLNYGASKQIFNQVQLQGIKIANDNSFISSTSKGWQVYGSNDDVTYTLLGSGTAVNDYTMQTFNLNSYTPYQYYRVNGIDSYYSTCTTGMCIGFQEVKFNKVSAVKNFGTYRAWDDDTYAKSPLEYLKGDITHSYSGDTGSGVYRIQLADGTVGDVYVDMITDGGGWVLVARGNYNTPVRHNGVVTPTVLGYVNVNAKNISITKIKELLITPTQNTTVYFSLPSATTLETGIGPKNADGYSGVNFPMSVRLSNNTFTQKIANSCAASYTYPTVSPWEGAAFLWNSYGWCQYGNGAFYTFGINTDTIPGGQHNMQTSWSSHDGGYQFVSLAELWIR